MKVGFRVTWKKAHEFVHFSVREFLRKDAAYVSENPRLVARHERVLPNCFKKGNIRDADLNPCWPVFCIQMTVSSLPNEGLRSFKTVLDNVPQMSYNFSGNRKGDVVWLKRQQLGQELNLG